MTGSSANESKPLHYSTSACSDDKVSSVNCKLPEKESFEHESDKSDATYTKSDTKFPISKTAQCRYLRTSGNKSNFTKATPVSARQRLYSSNGIIEPTIEASKRAQWLNWNEPEFARRRSFDEPKFCRRYRTQDGEDHRSTVAAFKRSLQLLGIKYADLGLDDIHKNNHNENKSSRGRATPTFSTQLKHRSVSLTNLRNAVQESGLPAFEAVEKLHRDILSRAVYEEWYFRKLTENKIKKELEEEILKKREKELQWIKAERQRKAEENFEKWKRTKAQRKKEQVKEGNVKVNKTSSLYARNKPNSDGAFESWKAKKDDERKKKDNVQKQLEEQQKKKKEEREKKEAAESAFKAWKQQIDDELKNKLKEREREKELIKEKKELELKKKQEEAQVCYNHWKKQKDKEIKEKLKCARTQAKKLAEEKGMKKAERQYDAAQAFEMWLDKVDERMEKEKLKKNSLTIEFPPWYPGIRYRSKSLDLVNLQDRN